MNKNVSIAFAILAVAFAAPALSQVRYDVSGAVKSVSMSGNDVKVEIDLLILDEHGNKVPGFQSMPGVNNEKTVEVKAYLCAANGQCTFEKMNGEIGPIDSIEAYIIKAKIPAYSTPNPGIYLVQGARRIFWIGVRDSQGSKVIAQGSTIVSASSN